jgi:tetratricopeptide (TPR) repeat protein
MAPEQLPGGQVCIGPRTDIYSLGIVLYEMLTGERPDSREPRPPRGVHPQLRRICMQCLAAPHQRYATAQDLANDLRRFQARSRQGRLRRVVLAALVCLTLALATYTIYPSLYKAAEGSLAITAARGGRKAEVEQAMAALLKKDYRGALKHTNGALADWKTVTLLCVKGRLHFELGEYEQALRACDEALRRDPDRAEAYYIQGLVYERQGRHEEALESFRPAADEGDPEARERLDALRKKQKRGREGSRR